MNRIEFQQAKLASDETFVSKDKNIKLYDGNEKTPYEDGEVVLTTHRLFWGRPGEIARGAVTLCLRLVYIVGLDEEEASSFLFAKKTRLILNLRPLLSGKLPGPMEGSTAHFIKLSGKHGIDVGFKVALRETLEARVWQVNDEYAATDQGASGSSTTTTSSPTSVPRIKLRTGIVGIERAIEEKHKATDEVMSAAFQDLKALMTLAEDMVKISKSISVAIQEQDGALSEDETIQFRSYLMSMGIDDPVTRDSFTNNKEYFKGLAREICELLLDPIEEAGGMLTLADAYCRVNRARGLQLISPQDLLDACKFLDGPMKLREFPSGVKVLQLESQDDAAVANLVKEKMNEMETVSVEELSRTLQISLILAKEYLMTAERFAFVCRDESIEGLRFYLNKFLQTA